MTTTTTQQANLADQPTLEQVLGGMSAALGGHLPSMVQVAATAPYAIEV